MNRKERPRLEQPRELDRLGDRERARLAGAIGRRTDLARPVHDRAERDEVELVDVRDARASPAVDRVVLPVAGEQLVRSECRTPSSRRCRRRSGRCPARRRPRRCRRRPRRCRCRRRRRSRSSPPSPSRSSSPSPPWASSLPAPPSKLSGPGDPVKQSLNLGADDQLEVRADVVALAGGAVIRQAVEVDRHPAVVALEHQPVGARAAVHRVRALVVVTAELRPRSQPMCRRRRRRPRCRCRRRPGSHRCHPRRSAGRCRRSR